MWCTPMIVTRFTPARMPCSATAVNLRAKTPRSPSRKWGTRSRLERVPHFLLGDRGVFALRLTAVAEQGIRAGVKRVTIIGVHHMAGGTAAGAKIAGVVVGP